MTLGRPHARSSTNWLLIGLIFVMGLFAATQFAKVSLTLAALGEIYATEPWVTALLVSCVGSVGILLGVIAGDLVARLGPNRALGYAVAAGAALSLLQAILPPFWLMALLRIAEGFAHLTIVVVAPTLMAAAASDRDRPIAMSLWAMFFGVAFALLSLVLPWILALGGVQLLFVLHGVGLAISGGLVCWFAPDAPGRVVARRGYISAHFANYSNAFISAPGLGFVFYTMIYIALLSFLPELYAQPSLGVVLPLISLLGTFAAGFAARHLRSDLVAAIGFSATVVCAGLVAVNATLGLYAMFFALGVIPGASFASIPAFNEDITARAQAAGTLAQMGNVGTTLGTPIFAVAIGAAGIAGLWGMLLIFCGAGLCALWISARRMARQSR